MVLFCLCNLTSLKDRQIPVFVCLCGRARFQQKHSIIIAFCIRLFRGNDNMKHMKVSFGVNSFVLF